MMLRAIGGQQLRTVDESIINEKSAEFSFHAYFSAFPSRLSLQSWLVRHCKLLSSMSSTCS